jgi:hypothetical protein
VARVDAAAEPAQLSGDVEIDLPVADVNGCRSDDELRAESFTFDTDALELGLDAVQRGEERELKHLLSRKTPQNLVIAVQNHSADVVADADLDGHVHASAERIAVGCCD